LQVNSPFAQHPFDLVDEIDDQRLGVLEFVRPAAVLLSPVIDRLVTPFEPRACGRQAVCVVEPDESRAIRCM